jgi:hypothetical protein
MSKLSRKSKNILWISIGLGICVLAIIILANRTYGTMNDEDTAFAVSDSVAINRIFLANSLGDKVLLERSSNGWKVNSKYDAVQANVSSLLKCIVNVRVKYPVGKAARKNISKHMTVNSTKVEIYFQDYRIKVGSLKLWQYTNRKIYYIGQQTMDNMGNFAILEGAKIPVVIYLPGFRGFIEPKYSPYEDSWRSHLIVDVRLAQIKEVVSEDFDNNANSFKIERKGERYFDIMRAANNAKLQEYDTLRMLDFLSGLRNLNYEFLPSNLTKEQKDTIFSHHFKTLTITDMEGKMTKISMFYLENVYDTLEYEYNESIMEAFNRDKFYAVINDNKEEVVLCQFFAFDRLIQPIEYFFINSKILLAPKLYEMPLEEMKP